MMRMCWSVIASWLVVTFFSVLTALDVFAQTGSPTLWEKCASGRIPGCEQKLFSARGAAMATTFDTLWPNSNLYTFLTANMVNPNITSTNANDDGDPPGSGAWTVTLSCVDADYVETTGTYTLDGTSTVSVTQPCMTIIDFKVATSAPGAYAAGNITLNAAGFTHGYIAAGYNNSLQAIGAVPAGYSFLCRNVNAAAANSAVNTYVLRFRQSTNKGTLYHVLLGGFSASMPFLGGPSLVWLPEKTQFTIDVSSSAGSGEAVAAVECLKISNSWLQSAQDIF